ncbi:histone acetyltransferase KAT6B-like isoform X1 [Dermacentor andersoni]|uniref:histone acetyltransferase KAT6B-like isoform X1 n=1 Tax=Dermacentor andersoni TaxID=34620 RepID=UPI00215591C2|nr:sterile alpha motif domain-containing protein 1-like isoform X1 [Dermacentor andersoni]
MPGTPKHKEIVLDTIDQLRKRKARPDFERICHMLYRRHGLSKAEVQEELDLLVDSEAVIKVDYKGNTSYRNAAKWVRFNKSLSSDTGAAAAAAATAVAVGCGGPQPTTFKVSRAIGDAVRDLWFTSKQSIDAADAGGVSAAELDAYLQARDFKCTKGALELGIDKELASGRLVRLPSGKFAPSEAEKQRAAKLAAACAQKPTATASPPKAPRVVKPLLQQACEGGYAVPPIGATTATCSAPPAAGPTAATSNGTNGVLIVRAPTSPTGRTTTASASLSSPPNAKRARPLSKRKRIKKTHGPDFLENLDSPTMDVTEFFEEDEPHCFVCYLSVPPTSNDYKALLICRDCNTKAHPSCLNYSAELAAAARLATWQCVDCKTCSGCSATADNDELIICDGCDRGYHMVCHRPKLTHRPQRKWLCKACCDVTKKTAGVKIKTEVDNSVGLPTPCDSPVPDEELKGFDGEHTDLSAYYIALDKYPDVVPDAKDWSVEEVEKFFVHIGFPEQAVAFRDQEIDGRSLLLLKRSDVLTGLSLKLGPALKIYNHIKRLQTGLPNGHLC